MIGSCAHVAGTTTTTLGSRLRGNDDVKFSLTVCQPAVGLSKVSHPRIMGSMSIPQSLSSRLALPVVASPLFIISNPDLVIAQCLGGIVGSFPALNARPQEALEPWIVRIKT